MLKELYRLGKCQKKTEASNTEAETAIQQRLTKAKEPALEEHLKKMQEIN